MSATGVLAADWHYPLLNLFWTLLMLFLWVLWFFLLFRIISDIFRSHDLSGWAKAAWTIFVIIVPFLAVLIYLIARGSGMARRDAEQAQRADQQAREYIRTAAAPTSTADELHKLAELRDRGVITPAEFEAQKAKLLV
jgi:hypothetical protein